MVNKPLSGIYYFDKPELNKCNRCGITQAEREKLPPMNTGINHPEYCRTKSFYLQNATDSKNGISEAIIWCPECHKEHMLEDVFTSMDRYAEKHGEEKLAKLFGFEK